MTSVDIEHVLRTEEIKQLLDAAEQSGSLRQVDLTEILELHELDALELEALHRELDQRGIERRPDAEQDRTQNERAKLAEPTHRLAYAQPRQSHL